MQVRRLLAVAILFLVSSSLAGIVRADDVPDKVRSQLEAPLKKRISDLLGQKDPQGNSYKRGAFSKSFTRVDDNTYLASFTQDTASVDRLKTERFRLTLTKSGPDQWVVSKEEVQDTFDGLWRRVVGSESFARFAGFSFEREGLKVTAGPGMLYSWDLNGKVVGFRLVAADLKYAYQVPTDLSVFQLVRAKLVNDKERRADFIFNPVYAEVGCDPVSCAEILEKSFTSFERLQAGGSGGGAVGGDSAIGRVYAKDMDEEKKDLKDNPFRGFQRPFREERRTWSIAFKRDSVKDHFLALDYDNFEPSEVNLFASGYGALFSYYSEETRKAGIDPYDLEKRPDAESRNYDLTSVEGTVELALEGDTVVGDVKYGMTVKKEMTELYFFIPRRTLPGSDEADTRRPRMFVNSIQDGSGQELTWVKLNAFVGLVVLPKAYQPGEKLGLRMQFRNSDVIHQLNPSYSEVDRGGWLPFVRFTDMVDKFDLVVKTPARYTVMGVGKKVSDKVEGDVRITHWTASSPVSFPTVIFGDYISDASSIKAQKKDGTPIPVNVYVDKVSTQSIDERVNTQEDLDELRQQLGAGARDIRGKQLKAIADQAANALNLYREIYGVDYPYDKLDLVADPLGSYYGQSPASIVYLGFGVFRGEGYVASDTLFGGGGANISKFNKDVVAHEVGHQWWGSLINNANTRNYWFIESLAEYSSALYVEAVNSEGGKNPAKGRKAYLDKVAGWRDFLLQAGLLGSVQNATSVWGGERPGLAYVANVYNKGPYAFHILRETFGDQKFFAFLKTLAGDMKGKGIVTRDIQRVAEQSFGGNMDWFFDQWLRGIGLPQYAFTYAVQKTEDGKYLVQGTIKQRVVVGPEKTPVPDQFYRAVMTVTAIGKGKHEYPARVLVEKPETTFKFKVAEEPLEVVLNKNGEALATDVFVNRGF